MNIETLLAIIAVVICTVLLVCIGIVIGMIILVQQYEAKKEKYNDFLLMDRKVTNMKTSIDNIEQRLEYIEGNTMDSLSDISERIQNIENTIYMQNM